MLVGNIATLFGVYLFEKFICKWNVRPAFWVTTVFTMFAALLDISMLTGFNRTMLAPFSQFKLGGSRMDDILGFLVGTQALKPIVTTLDDMPSTVLLSKLCPVGVETTVFAILAALQNLGFQISGLFAGQFLRSIAFKIKAVDEKSPARCDLGSSPIEGVNGLAWGMILGNIILPLFTIPATWVLLPNRNLQDDFASDEPTSGARETEMTAPGTAGLSKSFALDPDIPMDRRILSQGSSVFFRGAGMSKML